MDGQTLLPHADLIGHASGSENPASFLNVGLEFFGYFKDLCGLKPNERVLDLGCGCCRMALPLLDYLTPPGSYDGLDIHKPDIAWATAHVTSGYPHFRFHHADVHNDLYNPNGPVRPEHYRLPFADNTFDFALLTSVFTHMLPAGMRRYMAELGRVLKVGGRLLNTFFLLNDEAAGLIRKGRSGWQFPFHLGPCAVQDQDHPEVVVGFREPEVRRLYAACGLDITTIKPGTWCGRDGGLSCLDLVIATKTRQPGRSAGRAPLTERLVQLFAPAAARFRRGGEFARAA
jgi:SAM-dependent methyltransferase